MLRRLESLINQLQADDRSRLLGLIVGDLAGLKAARHELQRLAAEDPAVRTAALSFLEGLQGLRNLEHEAAADAQFLALAGEKVQ